MNASPDALKRASQPLELNTDEAARDARTLYERLAPVARSRLLLLWLVLVTLLGATAVFSFYSREQLAESLRFAELLNQAAEDTTDLIEMVDALHSSQRAYFIDGDPRFLGEYQQQARASTAQLARLRERTRSVSGAQQRVDEIEQALRESTRHTAQLVRRYQDSRKTGALDALRDEHSFETANALRRSAFGLQHYLLSAKYQKQALEQLILQRDITIYGSFLLAMIFGIGGSMLLRRYLATLREEELLRAKMLESRRESREKTNFLANVSHEIRTPMNAIFGFSRLLQEHIPEGPQRRYVEAIISSGRTLLALIDDVLDLSKIEAGKLELHPSPTSLRETADNVMTMFSQLAAEKGIALRRVVHERVPQALLLDPLRLRQILFNLIGNAIKYTDRGSVTLRIDAPADPQLRQRYRVLIEVEDTGIGIPAENLQAIFEPFVQNPRGRAESRKGTGLGLSITRQLAQLMGGTVAVSSTPGRGSTFEVVIPHVAATAAVEADEGLSTGKLAELPPSTILVVDDVAVNRELLVAMFRDSPHRLLEAASGEDALQLARSHQPDLILLDVRMPDLDGVQVVRALRREPKFQRTAIVAVTASTLSQNKARYQHLFDGYVQKPFGPETLYAELSRVLGKTPPVEPDAAVPGVTIAPALQAEFTTLLRTDWPRVRDTLAMDEVRQFARALALLGERSQLAGVRHYAQQLGGAAVNFDVTRIEKLLAAFPLLVRQVVTSPTEGG